jgi:antitoxin PrlF
MFLTLRNGDFRKHIKMASVPPRDEFEELSTLTDKGQTTVPKSVRRALGLSAGDKIAFHVGRSGVSLRRAGDAGDPAMESFLAFLARDIERHPENLKAFPPALKKRLAALVDGVAVDLQSTIEDDVAL